MINLSLWENQFLHALWQPQKSDFAIAKNIGFSVYRNTTFKGCVDAIQANFVATTQVVGETWLRAAATIFARQQPPHTPVLALYGASFAEFLRTFEPAQEIPYLYQVAQLDYAWIESYFATDAAPLAPSALAALSPENLAQQRLVLHPSCRFLYFDDAPIYEIWRCNHQQLMPPELEWQGQGVLLTRPEFDVLHQKISLGTHAFLHACQQNYSIALALEAALKAEPYHELNHDLALFLKLGVFTSIQNLSEQTL